MADPPVTSVDMLPQASFDVLLEALVHLGPTIRHEQDPTLSKLTSHSWDLLPGALLHTMPPTSVLRQCIQMPCHLDTEPEFAADFYLPSPAASSQPLRLPDGRWELGTSIQMVMVKSSVQKVTYLQEQATYASFKAWLLVVEVGCCPTPILCPIIWDQRLSMSTHESDTVLPVALSFKLMIISLDIYSWLETCGTLGTI